MARTLLKTLDKGFQIIVPESLAWLLFLIPRMPSVAQRERRRQCTHVMKRTYLRRRRIQIM